MEQSELYKFYRNQEVRDFEYTIKKGDTLYKIAHRFNVSLEDLLASNNITNSLIHPNQSIVIPSNLNSGGVYFEEYVTVPEDTLSNIASKSNVPLELLSKYNDVYNLLLAENQSLKIPRQFNKYVVQQTDDLNIILDKFHMTAEELINANRDAWLRPGTTINVK